MNLKSRFNNLKCFFFVYIHIMVCLLRTYHCVVIKQILQMRHRKV